MDIITLSEKLLMLNWEQLTKINEHTRITNQNKKLKIERVYSEKTMFNGEQMLVDYIDYKSKSRCYASVENIIGYIKDEEKFVDNMSYFKFTTLELAAKYTNKEPETIHNIQSKHNGIYVEKETKQERKIRQQAEIDREEIINNIKATKKFKSKQELIDYLNDIGADIKQQLIAGKPYISINNSPWLYVYDII